MELLNTTSLFQLPISSLTLQESIEYCLHQPRQGYFCFVNVHTLTESLFNSKLYEAFLNATVLTPDGVPLVWASKLKRKSVSERVSGPDFMHRFLIQYPTLFYGFIGGYPEQTQALIQKYQLKNALCYHPPQRDFSEKHALEDWESFLKLCPQKTPPLFIWVGLGAPKQEFWMKTVSANASCLFFGVGAAFDFLSAQKKRAPLWMQKIGLEWFYRFLKEPTRLWKRYLVTNFIFIAGIIAEILGLDIRKYLSKSQIN